MKLAMMAISLCIFGLQYMDEAIFEEGRSLYGRALLQLAKDLKSPGHRNRLRLILTARFLSLFEVC